MWLFLIAKFRDSNVVIRNLSLFNLSPSLFLSSVFASFSMVEVYIVLKASNSKEQSTTLSSPSKL